MGIVDKRTEEIPTFLESKEEGRMAMRTVCEEDGCRYVK